MKIPLTLTCIALAGCRAAQPIPPPALARTAPESRPIATAPADSAVPLALKLRQQAQYIDALISQNEALAARVGAAGAPSLPSPVSLAAEVATTPTHLPAAATEDPALEMLMPNADGVVDLTAAASDPKAADAVNPFVVRATGPAKEVTLRVSGIVAGVAPCAIVNDRIVQVNDVIEALTVERIGADWICLRYTGQRVRVPVSENPVKVKLPL